MRFWGGWQAARRLLGLAVLGIRLLGFAVAGVRLLGLGRCRLPCLQGHQWRACGFWGMRYPGHANDAGHGRFIRIVPRRVHAWESWE